MFNAFEIVISTPSSSVRLLDPLREFFRNRARFHTTSPPLLSPSLSLLSRRSDDFAGKDGLTTWKWNDSFFFLFLIFAPIKRPRTLFLSLFLSPFRRLFTAALSDQLLYRANFLRDCSSSSLKIIRNGG